MTTAPEVGRFGIKMTIFGPGFFRTNLLDPRNAEVIDSQIEDYVDESTTSETWAAYNGNQQGDPLKLGQAIVQIAAMDTPPTLFVAVSDATRSAVAGR